MSVLLQRRLAKGAAPEGRRRGTVRKWEADKVFGFITPDGAGADVFLSAAAAHSSSSIS